MELMTLVTWTILSLMAILVVSLLIRPPGSRTKPTTKCCLERPCPEKSYSAHSLEWIRGNLRLFSQFGNIMLLTLEHGFSSISRLWLSILLVSILWITLCLRMLDLQLAHITAWILRMLQDTP